MENDLYVFIFLLDYSFILLDYSFSNLMPFKVFIQFKYTFWYIILKL